MLQKQASSSSNADLYILQDELGYQDLSKELSYLIGASDYLSIGEVFDKYIDEFYALLSNQITVEVKKERRADVVIKLILSLIGLALIVYFLLNPQLYYIITINLMIFLCCFFDKF